MEKSTLMKSFTTLTAVAAPIEMANIDTDRVIPVRFLRKLRSDKAGYDPYLFHDMRFDNDGREKPDFVLNQPAYRKAGIIVAGANFGCGSSREGAVYALLDYGIRAVIAPSFGDIHYANELQNGMLPVILPEARVDVRAQARQQQERADQLSMQEQRGRRWRSQQPLAQGQLDNRKEAA